MKRSRALRIAGRLALAVAVALVAYLFIYRPLQLRWGATDEEVARAMPGDEIQQHPIFNATRAVTIDAGPEAIWPWLVQIGYRRAGWYGLDLIDNDGIPSSRRIVPELQHIKVGDILPISPIAFQRFFAIERNRYLLTKGMDDTTWIWALYPVDQGHTRLIWRMRSAPYIWTDPYIFPQLFTDATDVIAVRENMLGIKERVEGRPPVAPEMAYVELGLWFVAFLGFLGAEVGIVAGRDWRWLLPAALGAALITIAVVMIKPPIWVDGLAAIGVWAGVWWAYRQPGRRSGTLPGAGGAPGALGIKGHPEQQL